MKSIIFRRRRSWLRIAILLFLIVLGVCPSCSKGLKDIPLEEYNSYIQGYFDIENISVLERFNFSVDEEHKIISDICFR